MHPTISFVVATRNDNYGENLLHRIRIFMDALSTQWRQHHLQAELVIVEWNPPENEKPLVEALVWPDALPSDAVRIIRVPNELHRRLPNSDRMPMFEYIAKNVGIRRARGEYILATNPDILFSDELMRLLASGELSHDVFYRVDRHDVARTIPLGMPLKKQLRLCKRNAIRMHTLGVTAALNRRLPFLVRGWFANRSVRRLRAYRLRHTVRKVRVEDRLHTNASGDFLLMSQEAWFSLKGYPELQTHSHIDSYMCCMAASAGVDQIILPSEMRIYHQEHSRSSSSSRPMTSYEIWTQDCERMLREKRPLITNDLNWGLGRESLEEDVISAAYLNKGGEIMPLQTSRIEERMKGKGEPLTLREEWDEFLRFCNSIDSNDYDKLFNLNKELVKRAKYFHKCSRRIYSGATHLPPK